MILGLWDSAWDGAPKEHGGCAPAVLASGDSAGPVFLMLELVFGVL